MLFQNKAVKDAPSHWALWKLFIIMEQHNSISGIHKCLLNIWATCNYGQPHKPVIFVLSTCWLVDVYLLCPIWKPQNVMKILWDNSAKIFVWKKYQPTYMWIKDNVRKITIMWYNYHLFFSFMFCTYKISPNIVESWRVRSTLGSIDLWSRIRIFIIQ